MGTLWQDVKFGARMFSTKPDFTIIAVLTLALGIGANTALFSIVQAVLLNPLPYKEPDRLVRLYENKPDAGWTYFSISAPNAADWRDQNRVFEDVAPYRFGTANLTGGDEPRRVDYLDVPPGFFTMLGVQTVRGRNFAPDEDLPGNRGVAILSYAYWQSNFGGDEAALGETLLLNDEPHTVVGVTEPGFDYPYAGVGLWRPYPRDPAEVGHRGSHFLGAIARLKDGVTLEQAQTEMDGIAARLEAAYPETNTGWGVTVAPLQERVVAGIRPTLLLLWGAVGFVVLIACANVANLLLARATTREKEIAIRAALGAGRTRIFRQMLTESLLLAGLGGALGVGLAYLSMGPLLALSGESLPRAETVQLDATVLAFTAGLVLFAGLLFGLLPAWQGTRTNLQVSLREGGRQASGTGRHRVRDGLMVSQIALAVVLLVGAGLSLRSLDSILERSPGFNPEGVLTFRLSLPGSAYESEELVQNFREQLLARLESLPQVESAGSIIRMPPGGGWWINVFAIEGRPEAAPGKRTNILFRPITPHLFDALQIPIVRGRGLTEFDRRDGQYVAVVSETMAQRYWPDGDPIGDRIHFYDSDDGYTYYTVVGIAGDILDSGLAEPPTEAAYIPYAQMGFRWGGLDIAVRTQSDLAVLTPAVRRVVAELDPNLPVYDITPLAQTLRESLARRRFALTLLALFAGTALLLASVGIYGVIGYSVSRRTHEFGVRMALGARTGDVIGMVIRQAGTLIFLGLVLGLGGSLALGRMMESQLFGITARDPLTLAGVAAVLGLIAFAASYVPARRASRVDPMVALRYE